MLQTQIAGLGDRLTGFTAPKYEQHRPEHTSLVSFLTLDGLYEEPMQDIHAHSVTYRIDMGPQQGRKVFTLQTIPPKPDAPSGCDSVVKIAGFSLHAGVAAKSHQRDKIELLCRYIARAAISEKRLSLTSNGKSRYEPKTPYRNGTTHVKFSVLT